MAGSYIEQLETALKVIRTWAAYDDQHCKHWALRPADVVNMCDRALKSKESPK